MVLMVVSNILWFQTQILSNIIAFASLTICLRKKKTTGRGLNPFLHIIYQNSV